MKKIVTITTLSMYLLVANPALAAREIEQPSKYHITLESCALHTFDGAAIGINAEVVHLIIYARKAINQQLLGTHNPDNSYTGMYTFNNEKYTIQQLVALEDA